jgi:hypothetical protein
LEVQCRGDDLERAMSQKMAGVAYIYNDKNRKMKTEG